MNKHFNILKNFPADEILAITERYESDLRDNKIDAGAGIFKLEKDKVFIPPAIIEADSEFNITDYNTGYLSPRGETEWSGDEDFLEGTINLVPSRKSSSPDHSV